MEHEVKLYKRYKNRIKLRLVISGLWPDYSPHPKAFRWFLATCSGFTSAAITLGIVNYVYENATNVKLLTKGLGLMVGFLTLFFKVMCFGELERIGDQTWITDQRSGFFLFGINFTIEQIVILAMHEKDLRYLNEGLSVSFESDLVTPASRPHLMAHFRTFLKFFYSYDYSAMVNIIMLIVIPLMMIKHGKYLRMFPQTVPFSYEPGGIVHWSIFAFEVLGGFYIWTITCGVDSVFGLYTLHVVGELRLLSTRFENLKANENYKKELKDCVDRHVLLLQSRPILERVFGFLSIWLAVTCAIAMCGIIYQVSQATSMTAFRICYFLCYLFIKLVQAYSYAWYGNIITVESEMCLNSIYNAFWPDSGDTSFMKDILIVLSQKPFIFKAKSCVLLRLDIFSKIVKTSVSYYFLLRTLDKDFDVSQN